jgi:hypothetical protein
VGNHTAEPWPETTIGWQRRQAANVRAPADGYATLDSFDYMRASACVNVLRGVPLDWAASTLYFARGLAVERLQAMREGCNGIVHPERIPVVIAALRKIKAKGCKYGRDGCVDDHPSPCDACRARLALWELEP